ncbi:MAG: alpha-amylase [Treponema sp.]|jgi:glycosidase|nr:alpha-amylase [Treponema sp.]
MECFSITLAALEDSGTGNHRIRGPQAKNREAVMEFHIQNDIRRDYQLEHSLFSLRGNVVLADLRKVRELTVKFNSKVDPAHPERFIKAGQLYAMGLIDEILHYIAALYREQVQPDAFETALKRLENNLGEDKTTGLLHTFSSLFPPQQVYAGNTAIDAYLKGNEGRESCRSLSLEETMLLALANLNPAFRPFLFLFDDSSLEEKTVYPQAIEELKAHFAALPVFGPDGMNLWDILRAPAIASPDSLAGQLDYMRKHWGLLLGKFMARLLTSLDIIKEEEKPVFLGPGPSEVYTYDGLDEYEKFSPDQEWMPRTVLMAKCTLVWLYQLSKKYRREIIRLDQIPDEELDELARRGFTGLWLIGLWERSNASKTIKQWTGNPEAAASAYSLYDYDIAAELGGWGSLSNLRERCARRGIHLGSDMVPNHTGIDSRWIMEHPDRFLQLREPPFPGYTFNGGNLSNRDGVTVQIEDHYYSRTDAAVVFRRIDNRTGDTRYIYHGNDGTSMPWNDTAQIDFLNPEAREAVIRTIIGVCRQFSIVRFDAAMTLAKRHIQRLWYPEPGRGGDIASRAEHAVSSEEFNRRIPNEFWREVVDRCAVEAPNTLLLAEAFWMMEGYFVRTLGMHRVYNSAFMNMLKNEENAKYRATIKNTLEFDPEILKRFVNFMNNPDEETAVAQFGKGDKYFGICTLLATMPGLPMFGHGQIEGFEEKYGMEYRRSYRDENPDQYLVDRHEREIFPLLKRRAVFSGSVSFRLYDLFTLDGGINENVFAYSNRLWDDRALVLFNNSYYQTSGWIYQSSPPIPQGSGFQLDSLSDALSLHGEGRYFTLLREQRSGLWYIRSSKEICERGMFAALNGYEAQVFLDIHEVEDTDAGRWARLHHELNGRGIPDPEAAIQDIFLGELYYRFTVLLNAEVINGLKEALKGGRAERDAYIGFLYERTLVFIATAKRFIRGAEGACDPFADEGVYSSIEAEAIWEEFAAYLRRLFLLAGEKADAPSTLNKQTVKYLQNIRDKLETNEADILFALGYGIISLLRPILGRGASGASAKALLDHWNLIRKLREVYHSFNLPDNLAYNVSEIMKVVLSRTSPSEEQYLSYESLNQAENLILINYDTDDFRAMLGINVFDDVTWFNKESFEQALYYVPFFFTLENSGAFAAANASFKAQTSNKKDENEAKAENEVGFYERTALIADLADRFAAAEKEANYRFDRFIGLLSETNTRDNEAESKPAPKVKKSRKKK